MNLDLDLKNLERKRARFVLFFNLERGHLGNENWLERRSSPQEEYPSNYSEVVAVITELGGNASRSPLLTEVWGA